MLASSAGFECWLRVLASSWKQLCKAVVANLGGGQSSQALYFGRLMPVDQTG